MVKKLTRHGNSYALVIDKAILELLRITPDTPLAIATDGQTLTIAPATGPRRRARVAAAPRKVNRRYGRALKRLAE